MLLAKNCFEVIAEVEDVYRHCILKKHRYCREQFCEASGTSTSVDISKVGGFTFELAESNIPRKVQLMQRDKLHFCHANFLRSRIEENKMMESGFLRAPAAQANGNYVHSILQGAVDSSFSRLDGF